MADVPFSNFGASGVKSLQRGVSTVTTADLDITISAVDTSKAILFTDKATQTASDPQVYCQLLNSTTIRVIRQSSNTSTRFIAWQVLEYR